MILAGVINSGSPVILDGRFDWIERFVERDRLTLDIALYQDLFDCIAV